MRAKIFLVLAATALLSGAALAQQPADPTEGQPAAVIAPQGNPATYQGRWSMIPQPFFNDSSAPAYSEHDHGRP